MGDALDESSANPITGGQWGDPLVESVSRDYIGALTVSQTHS